MFCLYHFSVKCIIQKNYLPQYDSLNMNMISTNDAASGVGGAWWVKPTLENPCCS